MTGRDVTRTLAAVAVLAAGLASGCSSPEAERVRGGGKGADPQNYGDPIQIHGPKNPFHETPDKSPAEMARR